MHPFAELRALTPTPGDARIDWPAIWQLWPQLSALDHCRQDSLYHGEGDVGTHTRMVAEAMVAHPAWQALERQAQEILFWSTVLHDIGKPACTRREEDGRITSRGHSQTGVGIARSLLWAMEAPFDWRESVCAIIASHQLPFWLIERPDAQRLAIRASWSGRGDWLCLHAEADGRGRICQDQAAVLDNVELAREVFAEAQCLEQPFAFANAESRLAFFEHEGRDPWFAAHEQFRCTVTMLSGLPGSGKDTWIAQHRPDLPVVSLDAIRAEIGAPPTGAQGEVIRLAKQRAREHLRARRDFLWNATNVTRQIRARTLKLLRDYGARIEIVYLEPPRAQLLHQNRQREHSVPDAVIERLATRLEPPRADEAHVIRRLVAHT